MNNTIKANIEKAIKGMLEDYEDNHFYEVYELITGNAIHNGLWVSFECWDDAPDVMDIQIEYPDGDADNVDCKPDADEIRKALEKAVSKAEKMIEEITDKEGTSPTPTFNRSGPVNRGKCFTFNIEALRHVDEDVEEIEDQLFEVYNLIEDTKHNSELWGAIEHATRQMRVMAQIIKILIDKENICHQA